MAALIECLKYTLDQVLDIPAQLGLRPFRVFAVNISSSGSRPGLGTRTRVDTEILVGDGYPMVEQVSAKDVFSSGGLLNDKDLKLTIITSYNTGTVTGGTPREVYDPTPLAGNNTQIYFHLFGAGLPSDGQYFKKIWGKEDLRTTTVLYLRATGEKPGL